MGASLRESLQQVIDQLTRLRDEFPEPVAAAPAAPVKPAKAPKKRKNKRDIMERMVRAVGKRLAHGQARGWCSTRELATTARSAAPETKTADNRQLVGNVLYVIRHKKGFDVERLEGVEQNSLFRYATDDDFEKAKETFK